MKQMKSVMLDEKLVAIIQEIADETENSFSRVLNDLVKKALKSEKRL